METTIILFLVVLISNLNGNSQTFEYVPLNDYPTLNTNIFSLQCEGISNIQVQADEMVVERFGNGQGLNLTICSSTT